MENFWDKKGIIVLCNVDSCMSVIILINVMSGLYKEFDVSEVDELMVCSLVFSKILLVT